MKKVVLLLALSLVFLLCSCGDISAPATNTTAETPPAMSTSSIDPSTPAPASPAPSEAPAETPFDRFRSSLDDAGYSYEVVTMGAELVGASAGEKYKFDFGTVELYQFDSGSTALAKAKEDGGLTLEGFGVFPCEFNGDLAAVFNLTENSDAILSLFSGI